MAIKQFERFGAIKSIGARQVRVIASDATPDRAGDILVPGGADLSRYRQNPVCLWQHDSSSPIARTVDIGTKGGQLIALIQFPEAGISDDADEAYGLVKSGVVSAVSVGFSPIQSEPARVNGKATGGVKYLAWELLEISFVSVPCNPSALVTERALKSGRVLSGANSSKINAAHDAAAACHAILADVLDGAGSDGGRAISRSEQEHYRRKARAAAIMHPPLTPEHARRQRQAEALKLAVLPDSDNFRRRQREAEVLRLAEVK